MKIFIGYDPSQIVAYHVATHSIMSRASVPVSITGLMLPQLPLTRPREGSTEFTFSRFLVPWLCGFRGSAVFMDCDVLVRGDIASILPDRFFRSGKSVCVVMHQYTPLPGPKFLGNRQEAYPRKNWSSVMLFNNELCQNLDPDYVNSASALDLHRFKWLRDDQIGALPAEWNHLVGELPPNPDAKIVHFTRGGPWFAEYADCEFADEWREELRTMLGAVRQERREAVPC